MTHRIAHIGAWGRNYGDRAIQWGVQQALGSSWDIGSHDCQGTRFHTAAGAEWLNQNTDVVLVGGGGLLWDKPELHSVSGWQWQVTREFLEALRVPVVVWGIGWTAFPTAEDQTGQLPAFRDTLGWLVKHAAAFTVRNPQTRYMLDMVGVDVENVDIVADPALGAPWYPWRGGSGILALCWASDKHLWRWKAREGEWNILSQVVKAAQAMGLRVRVVPHLAGMDGWLVERIRASGAECASVEELVPYLYPAKLENVQEWARLAYADADIVVSMRKHGVLVPAGMGAPVVGLGELGEVAHLAEMLRVQMIREGEGEKSVLEKIRGARPADEQEITWARMCNESLAVTLADIVGGTR